MNQIKQIAGDNDGWLYGLDEYGNIYRLIAVGTEYRWVDLKADTIELSEAHNRAWELQNKR
jgi:hypothetical protein